MASSAALPLHDVPARRDASATGLVFADERWSWGRLDRRSRHWARHLLDAGIAANDFVAFALPNGPGLIALVFSIYRAGAAPADGRVLIRAPNRNGRPRLCGRDPQVANGRKL